jgi:hypothetical protein
MPLSADAVAIDVVFQKLMRGFVTKEVQVAQGFA